MLKKRKKRGEEREMEDRVGARHVFGLHRAIMGYNGTGGGRVWACVHVNKQWRSGWSEGYREK